MRKHKNDIVVGDAILYDGEYRTVCSKDIKNDDLMGRTIFGDSFKLGNELVDVFAPDQDGLDLAGVTELPRERERNCLSVLIQRDTGRVTRYFGEGWEKVYNQCHKNPKVLMYNPL